MDTKLCTKCNTEKHWRRFRIRVGGGLMRESDLCSTCRAKSYRAKPKPPAVLNRTNGNAPRITPKMDYLLNKHDGESFKEYQIRKESGFPYYYPKLERSMRAYANKKTAMDRKYLRDNQDKPLSTQPHIAQMQRSARQHAKGWIAFYDEILSHAINLLRQTGTRPPWAQLEGKSDLHRLYGVWNTRRAQLLRERG